MDSIIVCNAHPFRVAVFFLKDGWQGWYRCPECHATVRGSRLVESYRFHTRPPMTGEHQGR